MKITIESTCKTDSPFVLLQALEETVRLMRNQLKNGLPTSGSNQVPVAIDLFQTSKYKISNF